MIQCFAKKNYKPLFQSHREPSLLYVSKTGEEDSIHPRVMHAHEDFVEIILICSGSGEYLIGGRQYPVKKGDLVVYNSNIVHDEVSGPEIKVKRFCCAVGNIAVPGLRENALTEDAMSPIFPCGIYFEPLEQTYSAMFALLSSGTEAGEEACHYLMKSLLSIVWAIVHLPVEKSRGSLREDADVLGRRIKTYIDEHFTEEITLQTLSEALNISPYYLSHVFKKQTGYAPMQYVLRRRIGEAQTLLITTDYSITAIAAIVGYNTPNHFNALFTKNVGMSPRKYRKNYIVADRSE